MSPKDKHLQEEIVPRLQGEIKILKERLAGLNLQNQSLAEHIRENRFWSDSCPIGLVLIQKDRILELNPLLQKQLGYPAEEIKGRSFWSFVAPNAKSSLKERAEIRRKGKWAPAQFETTLIRKDGSRMDYEIRFRRFRHHGRSALLAGLIESGSRLQYLNHFTQNQKNEMLLTLANGLKHQLAPGLMTLQEQCLVLAKSNLNQKEPLRRMQTVLDQIQTVMHTLERLAQTTYEPHECSTFDLKPLVRDLAAEFAALVQEVQKKQGIALTFKTYLRAAPFIYGHPQELREAIRNLLLNALEAIPGGGTLFLSTEESDGWAHIYIQDSGPGIPRDLQTRVLDPFFSTKGGNRPGLGLALAAAVIRRHQGNLGYGNDADHGGLLTVKLPLVVPEIKKKSGADRQKIKNAQILILDNQDLTRPLLAQLLEGRGLKVLPVATAFEALSRLKAKAYDLIWIGASVPDMHRIDLLPEIRRIRPQIATAWVSDRQERAETITADLILHHPLDMNKAVAQVLELLRRKN